jgi:type IV pilus assembly protein PilN
MRTKINLATQPYEDAREYLERWGALLGLLLLVTIALVWFTFHAVRQSSDMNRQLSQMRNDIATLDSDKVRAERTLALPQNKGTVDKSEYLNTIFARKAFSWTTVFSDMEKLMPPGLRVLSIAPTLDDQNQLQVHIVVGGESRARANELVRNLEKTPRFRDVALRSATMDVNTVPGQGQSNISSTGLEHDPIRFDIEAHYLPINPNRGSQSSGSTAQAVPATPAPAGSGGAR